MAGDLIATRFSLVGLTGLDFIRYPASVDPEEGTMACVGDDQRQRFGQFVGGRWCNAHGEPLKPAPTYWTVMEKRNG